MTNTPITPIFLLSLPRSGSTLVQRILAAHDGVATASEPWLLLPWLSPLRPGMRGFGSWHQQIHEALEDFACVLPGGTDDYRETVHDAALHLYARAAGPNARFFVDKTPPYAMIIDEIARTFPEGRLVFLFRNPLGVVSSLVQTFAGGRWRPSDYPTSLFAGAAQLIDGRRRHCHRSFAVRYEDLVGGHAATWDGLCEYCGFHFERAALERFRNVELGGRLGDPASGRAPLSLESADKWKHVVSTPVRKEWCRRYLRWLGRERLSTMGYDLDALLTELSGVSAHGGNLGADVLDAVGSLAKAAVKARFGGDRGTPAAWRAVLGS